MPRARANKTGLNLMIFILIFIENWMQYGMIHDFSVLEIALPVLEPPSSWAGPPPRTYPRIPAP